MITAALSRSSLSAASTILGVALLSACSGGPRSAVPHVREIYADAAKREARNPVVVIHGILGARLVESATGKIVWGAFTDEAIDPETPEGVRLLAVPPSNDAMDYNPETAEVVAAGPLGALEVGLFFNVFTVEVYAGILRALGVGGYLDKVGVDPVLPQYSEGHFSCFTFFYDWRRDNVENAIALGRYLEKTRVEVNESSARRCTELRAEGSAAALEEADEIEAWFATDWKFDVVAHSMGGLVSRYYARYGTQDLPKDGSDPVVTWAGSKQIGRLLLVGTPNLGAMDSLQQLTRGFDPGPFLPHYHSAVLGTMPSIYQLLPRTQNQVIRDSKGEPTDVDLFDVEVWDQNGWGMLNPDSDKYLTWLWPELTDPESRRARARSTVGSSLSRAKAFHRSLDQRAEPGPVQMRLFASGIQSTIAATKLERRDGKLVPTFSDDSLFEWGDGTVPRFSAVADLGHGLPSKDVWLDSPVEWESVTFLPDDHVGLTSNPLFTDNMLYFLLREAPRSN